MDQARQQLEQIPPPSKNRYLAVRTQDAYANPFLVVHPQTVTLTIIYRDQLQGIRMELPAEASCARPKPASRKSTCGLTICPRPWPLYRRMSGPTAAWLRSRSLPPPPRAERVAIRRNVEATIETLNDLGVVVDEWTGSNGALLR